MQEHICKEIRPKRNKSIFKWVDAAAATLVFFVFIFTLFFRLTKNLTETFEDESIKEIFCAIGGKILDMSILQVYYH